MDKLGWLVFRNPIFGKRHIDVPDHQPDYIKMGDVTVLFFLDLTFFEKVMMLIEVQ